MLARNKKCKNKDVRNLMGVTLNTKDVRNLMGVTLNTKDVRNLMGVTMNTEDGPMGAETPTLVYADI
jgi:hypothetical protein